MPVQTGSSSGFLKKRSLSNRRPCPSNMIFKQYTEFVGKIKFRTSLFCLKVYLLKLADPPFLDSHGNLPPRILQKFSRSKSSHPHKPSDTRCIQPLSELSVNHVTHQASVSIKQNKRSFAAEFYRALHSQPGPFLRNLHSAVVQKYFFRAERFSLRWWNPSASNILLKYSCHSHLRHFVPYVSVARLSPFSNAWREIYRNQSNTVEVFFAIQACGIS